MNISCILLSAGLSERFGSPKALAKLSDGKTVIEHLLQNLLASSLSEIIIVLGANADQIKPVLFNHTKVRVVYNKDYLLGQTSSFKIGLQNVSLNCQGVMLLPVDYPFVKTETLNFLIDQFASSPHEILIPSYSNRKGHPPLFPIQLSAEFLTLDNNLGINTVIHNHPSQDKIFPVNDSGVIKTFNTREEFENK